MNASSSTACSGYAAKPAAALASAPAVTALMSSCVTARKMGMLKLLYASELACALGTSKNREPSPVSSAPR